MESELRELATVGYLTKLPNRRHFMNQSELELIKIRRRESRGAALLMIDIYH